MGVKPIVFAQGRWFSVQWFFGPEKSGKSKEIARRTDGFEDVTAQLVWEGDDAPHRLKQLLARVSIVFVESQTPPPPDLWDTLDLSRACSCLSVIRCVGDPKQSSS